MTGRYGHRGGRGGHGGRSTPSTLTKETKKKKSIEDYFFYVGSSKQASDFETTSEFLVNYVKKTFDRGNDVAEALRTLTPEDTELWKPTLQFSTATEDTKNKQENRQHELEYKANLDEFRGRGRTTTISSRHTPLFGSDARKPCKTKSWQDLLLKQRSITIQSSYLMQ
jgi:hypothetical protein